jgi:hypothetical protein
MGIAGGDVCSIAPRVETADCAAFKSYNTPADLQEEPHEQD